jgi:hypothetical protein
MPKRTWTDEQLVDAVAANTSLAGVMRSLGLRPGDYDRLRSHIRRVGVEASHIRAAEGALRRRPRTWTDDDLAAVVARSTTYAEVMRDLGDAPSGGVHRWIENHIRVLGLRTDHFVGSGWAKGLSRPSRPVRPLAQLLVEGSPIASGLLRRRLIDEGLKPAHCETCGLSDWLGEALPLLLDHINGDPMDNRHENLRILCPNCHACTPTWCAGNRKKPSQPA